MKTPSFFLRRSQEELFSDAVKRQTRNRHTWTGVTELWSGHLTKRGEIMPNLLKYIIYKLSMCLWGKCINDLCADCCYGKKSGIDVEFLVTMFFF